MAAPTIQWFKMTGTTTAPTYASIASLDYGTVTAGTFSLVQSVTPKVATNSIQSAELWMYDTAGVRSAASVAMGSAGSFTHRVTATGTYVKPSGVTPSATWGTEMPESTGSGYAYSAVSDAAYGDFIMLAVKVPSAAGDGAHTAWGYQLNWALYRVICKVKFVKFGEIFKMTIPSEIFMRIKRRVETRWQISAFADKERVQTANTFYLYN